MPHRIEIAIKPGQRDIVGEQTKRAVEEELKVSLPACHFVEVYNIEEDLTEEQLQRLGGDTLVDTLIQTAHWKEPAYVNSWRVEIGFLPGVTDNVGTTAMQAIHDALGKDAHVYYTRIFAWEEKGSPSVRLDEPTCYRIAQQLHNPLVEKYHVYVPGERPKPYLPRVVLHQKPKVQLIRLEEDPQRIERLVKRRLLALSVEEMRAIAGYLNDPKTIRKRKRVGLDERITDAELEALAQTWSEHCKHKIFNAEISYSENGEMHSIDSLFSVFIRGATEAVRKPYVVSVFHDNGGIIKLTPEYDVAVKVETHNAPSALDPYGGALTGVLGVQRDILGTGLGAMPIASIDVLCFGNLNPSESDVPKGTLHPKKIMEGVVKGIEHAGNKTGIPTVNGSILFEKEFIARPLVYCGTIGILPSRIRDTRSAEKRVEPGYLAVMVGGRIGKDGIHGATFSSQHIDESVPQSVVQIGDPITQKKAMDFVLEARDARLYDAITDNGAGGLSSSIGEMARASNGCEIYLDKCPLKYPGLNPWEILVSESQERMTLAVPEKQWPALQQLARKHEVEVSAVGKFTDSGYFHCLYRNKTVAYLEIAFLHEGVPRMKLRANWKRRVFKEPENRSLPPADVLKKLLTHPNIASKEAVVHRFDHEVKGMSVIKPLGTADAAVIRPVLGQEEGIAVGHGICPRVIQDSYRMATLAFDEAVRNVLAVGGKFGYMAALDNFSWPDPVQSEKTPDGEYKLAQLVRACIGVYDVSTAYGVPLVSGKDSMKNDYYAGEHKYSILPTLLITAIAKLDTVHRALDSAVKNPGDRVYVLGTTHDELGGSEYYKLLGGVGNHEPKVDIEKNASLYKAFSRVTEHGLVASAHDISDGGFAVALVECILKGPYGIDASLAALPKGTDREEALLFAETPGRFIVTVAENNAAEFEKCMRGQPVAQVGRVRGDKRFLIRDLKGEILINEDVRDLRIGWEKGI